MESHICFKIILFTFFILIFFYNINFVSCCNDAVCGPIVSKCMLTESCKCDFKKNSSCTRLCVTCLDYLYNECCSCVELCPQANATIDISAKSHVEELKNAIPDLFTVLTEEEDPLLRWKTYTMPLEIKFLITDINNGDTNAANSGHGNQEVKYSTKIVKTDSDGIDKEENIPINCTVAYMSQCMSLNKCKQSCTSMGASSYRWFHDGCCECVGRYCIDYGINESRCLQCSVFNEEDEKDIQSLKEGIDSDYSEPVKI